MSHIVLFFPRTDPRSEWVVQPLSLLHLAAVLKDSGCSVSIVDARIAGDWKEVLAQAVKMEPLFFGVSSMTGHQISGAIEASEWFRTQAPKVPVVWGGVHPSLLPEETLLTGPADLVVRGEGEIPVRVLVRALEGQVEMREVPGISYLEGGKVLRNPEPEPFDLDRLPAIPYGMLPLEQYGHRTPWPGTAGSLAYLTSKGCPFFCAYCYNQTFYHRKWRAKSAHKVLAEMSELAGMAGRGNPLKLFLLDDNFFADLQRVEKIVEGILSSPFRPEIYNANCRVDTLLRMDSSLLESLRQAGIKQLFIGVESGSDRILQSIRKGFSLKMVLEANRKLKQASLEPVYSFMAGFPGETPRDVKDTLRLMVRLLEQNPRATITELSFYSPFPGTALLERLRERGWQPPSRLEAWAEMSYNQLVEDLFPAGKVPVWVHAKLMSSQLDLKYTQRQGWLKKLLARLLAWEIRWRVKAGMVGFFPEKTFLNKYRSMRPSGRRRLRARP